MTNPTNPKASKKLKLNAEKISAVKAGAEVTGAVATPSEGQKGCGGRGIRSSLANAGLQLTIGNCVSGCAKI